MYSSFRSCKSVCTRWKFWTISSTCWLVSFSFCFNSENCLVFSSSDCPLACWRSLAAASAPIFSPCSLALFTLSRASFSSLEILRSDLSSMEARRDCLAYLIINSDLDYSFFWSSSCSSNLFYLTCSYSFSSWYESAYYYASSRSFWIYFSSSCVSFKELSSALAAGCTWFFTDGFSFKIGFCMDFSRIDVDFDVCYFDSGCFDGSAIGDELSDYDKEDAASSTFDSLFFFLLEDLWLSFLSLTARASFLLLLVVVTALSFSASLSFTEVFYYF